jgi:hypothetical protein
MQRCCKCGVVLSNLYPAKSLNGASPRILNGPGTKSRLFEGARDFFGTIDSECHFWAKTTIRQAMASVPTVTGTTVNFKIVVVNDTNNCGPITF